MMVASEGGRRPDWPPTFTSASRHADGWRCGWSTTTATTPASSQSRRKGRRGRFAVSPSARMRGVKRAEASGRAVPRPPAESSRKTVRFRTLLTASGVLQCVVRSEPSANGQLRHVPYRPPPPPSRLAAGFTRCWLAGPKQKREMPRAPVQTARTPVAGLDRAASSTSRALLQESLRRLVQGALQRHGRSGPSIALVTGDRVRSPFCVRTGCAPAT